MKKVYSLIALAASVVIAAISCSKEVQAPNETIEDPSTEVSQVVPDIHFNAISNGQIAPAETKTAAVIDGDETYVKWLSTDRLIIVESATKAGSTTVNSIKTSGAPSLTAKDGHDDVVASFGATVSGSPVDGAEDYIYTAIYPSVVVAETETNLVEKTTPGTYRLNFPSAQHLQGNNLSSDSDLLISTPVHKGATRVVEDEDLEFRYKRIGTLVKLTLKGLTASETIQSVTVTAPKNIAGFINVNPAEGSYETAPYYNQRTSVTLTVDDVTTTGNDIVWFRVLPGAWESGQTLQVVVETDKATYSRTTAKSTAIALTKNLEFVDGGLTKLAIGFSASNREEKSLSTTYTMVSYQGEIGENAEYIIAANNNSSTYAASSFSSTLFSSVDVSSAVSGNDIVISTQNVAVFSLEATDTDGQYYLIADGEYYYVTSNKGNKLGKSNSPSTDYYKWTITPSGIVNVGYSSHSIQFNYNNGNSRFTNYSSSQTAISIYKHGEVKALLDPELLFTPSHKDVAWDSKESFVAPTLSHPGEVVSFTYSSSDEDVVTIDSSNGDISFVGNGNATITVVSAKTENYRSSSAEYTITVTGAPVAKGAGPENPYSVEEALTLIPNSNDATDQNVYVIGKVKEIGTYSSGTRTYTLEDITSGVTIKVYKGKDLNNTAFTNADGELNVDDELIIIGKLLNYNGTPEINTPNYIYSWNGKVRWLEEPTVTALAEDATKRITVSWNKVDYATSYLVECGDQDYTAGQNETSKVFTMADYGDYTVKVTAMADDGIDGESEEVNVTLTNPDTPVLTATTSTSLSWTAKEYGEENVKTVSVDINTNGTYTCSESDSEWNISTSRSGDVITVSIYPKSTNDSESSTKEKVVVLHHSSGVLADIEISCIQAKATVETEDITFNYISSNQSGFGEAASQSYNGINITTTGSSNPQCAYNGNQFRTYQNGTVTFSTDDNTKKIIKIVITVSGTSYAKLSGNDFSWSSTTGTWNGTPANTVSLSTTGTSRITKIVVTKEK